MTSELSQCDRNLLTLSNSALACSPSLLPRLTTCLGLSTTTRSEERKRTGHPTGVDDMAELQERVDGHGEGGAPQDALQGLFRSRLSVPESMLVRPMRVTGGGDEEGGGWGGPLSSTTSSSSFSRMLSCRTA